MALRLQLRRLLREAAGVSIVHEPAGSWLLLDAGQTLGAAQAAALREPGLRGGLLLLPPGARTPVGLPAGLRCLPRPADLEQQASDGEFARALLQRLGVARPGEPGSAAEPTRLLPSATGPVPGGFELLAIGASTGGPQALALLLAGLRGRLTLPVLITQHLGAGFTAALARSLSDSGALPTVEATDGLPLLPGRAHLAPAGRHLRVERQGRQGICRLDDGPPEQFCKPAVDVMLRSLAQAPAWRTLVVMLSGMGQDGLQGCRELARCGGVVLAQDQASSVVWGMPGAVAKAGLCRAVLPLQQLPAAVLELLTAGR